MRNAPDALLRLIDRSDRDRKVFVSPDYKEEQLRLTAGHQTKVKEKPRGPQSQLDRGRC
jgi:hypothetical protein